MNLEAVYKVFPGEGGGVFSAHAIVVYETNGRRTTAEVVQGSTINPV